MELLVIEIGGWGGVLLPQVGVRRVVSQYGLHASGASNTVLGHQHTLKGVTL